MIQFYPMKENDIQSRLTKIEQLIRGDLAVTPKSVEVCNLEIDSEIQSVKKHLKETLLNSNHTFEKTLIFVQASIQQLLAEGSDRLSSLKSSVLGQKHLNERMNHLMDLLDELQVQNVQCFRLDFKAPELYIQAKQREMTLVILQLKSEFKEKLDDRLTLVLNSEVYVLPSDCTYQQIASFKDRLHALKNMDMENLKSDIETPVVFSLLKNGLDTARFLELCIERIENQAIHTVEDMGSFSSEWHRAFLVAEHYATKNKTDSFMVGILEKALKRRSRSVHQFLGRDDSGQTPYFHATTSLVQLLYLFKLWIDTGVMKCENRSGLYHFIHRHVETDRVAHPTVGSMQRKYGTAKKSDKTKVKNLLIVMLNQINQELSSDNA